MRIGFGLFSPYGGDGTVWYIFTVRIEAALFSPSGNWNSEPFRKFMVMACCIELRQIKIGEKCLL